MSGSGGVHLQPVDAVGAVLARRAPDVDGAGRQHSGREAARRTAGAAAALLDVDDQRQALQVLVGLAVQLEVGLERRAVLAERAEVRAGADDRHARRLVGTVLRRTVQLDVRLHEQSRETG